MRTKDFEQAIEALGVHGLTATKFSYGINRQVSAVYARMGERTYLKWDASGRGFVFEIAESEEGQVTILYPEYLDYRRDNGFDLKFE